MTRNNCKAVWVVLAVLVALLCAPAAPTWAGKDDLKVIDPNVVDLGKEMAEAKVAAAAPIVPEVTGFDPLKYTLGPEDVIEIQVLRHPEFSGTYPINLEGKIQYKFVGDMEITGLTKKELEDEIKSLISKYVINPQVDVTIMEYKSKVIYVLGEVAGPGKYYMKSENISVRDAVVAAGLPTHSAAMRKCQLITPAEDNQVEVKIVNIYEVLYGGNLDKNIDMHPGDVLYVPSTVVAKLLKIISPVVAPVSSAASGVSAANGVPIP